MTKRLIATAVSVAALLLGAGSAFAASAPKPAVPSIADGFISIAVGGATLSQEFEGDSFSSSGVSLQGAASGAYNYRANLGFQGDLLLGSQDYPGEIIGDGTLNDRDVEAALHAFYRNDQYLIGAFGQYGNNTYTFSEAPGFAETLDHYYGGIEGQAFFGNATIYGQAGAQQFRAGSISINGIFGTLEARYFLQPNFKIDAHIGADTLQDNFITDGETVTTVHAGAGAEYRLDNAPLSIFAKYDFSRTTSSAADSGSASDNRFLVGVKFNFDSPTLMDRDRTGASLKPVDNGLDGLFGGLTAPR